MSPGATGAPGSTVTATTLATISATTSLTCSRGMLATLAVTAGYPAIPQAGR
ncbi:hypothetical protein GCM10012276_18960 [Nocardioides deserti]|nr:hypothetical protein GCM10012276_18960 [Nocardioides deserti]